MSFQTINEAIQKAPTREFISYAYMCVAGNPVTVFCKKYDDKLYIKAYTLKPGEAFNKKYIKKFQKEHGYHSETGMLIVAPCKQDDYKDLFFKIINKYFVLNPERVAIAIRQAEKRMIKYAERMEAKKASQVKPTEEERSEKVETH